jgi:hypothetical protein
MNRKRLIIISSVVSAVIVLAGLVGGTVLAASSATSATNPQSVFTAKVATILGIDQAEVEAAFTQAEKEMRTEALDARLAKLVADGKMTQAQADQYKTWLESKPDVPAFTGPKGGPGGEFRGMMGGGFGGRGFRGAPPCAVPPPAPTD